MAIRLPQLVLARRVFRKVLSTNKSASGDEIHKGYFATYVGDDKKRFVIPTSYLKNSAFQDLLRKAEEEYGFHPNMGLTIPCSEDVFRNLTLRLARSPLQIAV